jgi:predicted transposase/invertase (TIGR01784 family)
VVDIVIRNNELPPGDVGEKAERLDINCVTDNNIQVDVEMQASYIRELLGGHQNLFGKSIYYLCDLHSSQSSIGKSYDELARTYQITFCMYPLFPERQDFINPFAMRHDTDNGLLHDALHIVFVELSKLDKVLQKPVDEMTDLEKWAVFFRYANIPEYREVANKVIESKEVLKVAGTLLTGISQDERERAIFRSRRMYQSDQDSNMVTVKREAETTKAFTIAKNLLEMDIPIEKIVFATGLTREQVENLRESR